MKVQFVPVVATAVGVGFFVFASPALAQRGTPPPAPVSPLATDALDRMNEAIAALTRKVWPSVVQIQVTSLGAQAPAGRGGVAVIGQQRSVGSGFVIDGEGYIMTNAHVVANAQRVQVILPPANADGSLKTALSPKLNIVPARIVGLATELDLALLKVDGVKLPALPMATYSDVRQGETVFAFGSPSGLRNTLTHGLVSAVARQIDPDSPLIYIQTDAPINPGNSGGPLVNTRGEVVGVNTFIMSGSGGSDGLGFAIPSATAKTAFKQLRQYGQLRRQEIGISLQTITPDMAAGLGLERNYGVIISDVWPGGPAEKAHVMVGDIILSVDGQPAENLPTVNYFFRLRDSAERVQLVVQRGAAQWTLSVAPVEDRDELDAISSGVDPTRNIVNELGILGVEIDPKVAAVARGLRSPTGVVVVARVAGARGEVPLLPRDIIRSLNTRPISTLQILRDAVRGLPAGTPVTLQIQRDGRLMYLSFVLD